MLHNQYKLLDLLLLSYYPSFLYFIYAKNITLGEGAQIKDFIKLGENVLLKSVNEEKSFLTVTNKTGDAILNMNSLGEI